MPRLWLTLAAAVVYAADDELYDPAPPADAAFVRVIHAATGATAADPQVGGSELGAVSYGGATPYAVVPQGAQVVRVGTAKTTVTLEARAFYSLAILPGPEVLVLRDTPPVDLSKALLVLYNLSDAAEVSLLTADGAATVIPKVPPRAMDRREVNAVAAKLTVQAGNRSLPLPEVALERGAAFGVVVVGQGQTVQAGWIRATTRSR